MDPLDLKTNEELLSFFNRKKAEMSCIQQPHKLLTQLRDHRLVPEKHFENVKNMHTRKQKEKHFYEVLDWLEKDRPQNIQQFWRCVFDDHMQLYPTLRMLRNSLLDSPIKLYEKPLDIQTSTEEKTEKGKEKGYTREDCIVAIDDPVVRRILPFSPPSLKTLKKLHKNFSFSSPVKKGDEQEIWTWSKYETQLPVTCGDKEDKLTGGGKCILSKGGWFTPDDFEKFWGKETCKNWKFSIRCENILQKKLIEDGCLQCPQRKSEKRTCAQNVLCLFMFNIRF